ncbi:TMEM175 family protein [Fructilactobacillus sp. Tb1]|uniref:TMEM175 family protein n=1 Tax=Fructilactobacillus sp. Tb1 TaxID=3422304 RepID=UPI003D289101
MNKGRIEAFTDAIIAIVITIMVLDIKVPESYHIAALLKEWPSFFAYAISFFYIAVAWYNHHYMFSIINWISKKTYWANMLWLFVTCLFPVSTAWIGEYITYRGPEYIYFGLYTIWNLTYLILSKNVINGINEQKDIDKIYSMSTYKLLNNYWFIGFTVFAIVLIWFYPPIALIFTFIEAAIGFINTNPDSDRLNN